LAFSEGSASVGAKILMNLGQALQKINILSILLGAVIAIWLLLGKVMMLLGVAFVVWVSR
jgi:hypothetical protein